MGSRGSKKKANSNTSNKNTKAVQNRKIWWQFYKKKIITLAAVVVVIAGIITVASLTSRGENNVSTDGQYTLMDLGSSGCEPCDRLQPVLTTLRTKYSGSININFYDVNRTSEGMQLASQYGVSSIPTLIYIANGNEVFRTVGYRSQAEIEAEFRRLGWV